MTDALGPALRLAPAFGPWFGLAALIAVLLKAWRPFREMAIQHSDAEATRQSARIDALERLREEDRATWAAERTRLDEKIEAQRALYEARLEAERARYEGEIGKLRHRANNADACLDSFVLLLETEDTLPPKAKRALGAIKEMRDRQREERAVESAALMRAKFDAASQQVAAAKGGGA